MSLPSLRNIGAFQPVAAEFYGKIFNTTQESPLTCPYKLTKIWGLSKLGSTAQIMTVAYNFSLLILETENYT